MPEGEPLFPGVSYKRLLDVVQDVGVSLGYDASDFGTQSIRRGGAQQIAKCAPNLAAILSAGAWSSRAFMDYMDSAAVARDAMLKCVPIEDASSDED